MIGWLEGVPAIYYLSALAGAAGGLVCFLEACRTNRIRNKHGRKAVLEVVGGLFVGFFLSVAAAAAGASELVRGATAFVGGIGWAAIAETVRQKITDVALALFFGQIKRPAGGGDDEAED